MENTFFFPFQEENWNYNANFKNYIYYLEENENLEDNETICY